MVKDLIMSFKDNVDKRAKNPFLGTFAIVWIVRNWELVYTLFNFDDEHKLEFKVQFIRKYYDGFSFWCNFWVNTYWSLIILVLSYLLLNISRFVVNFSEKKVKPQIYKITDKSSIVLKEELERVRDSRNEIQNTLNAERDSKANLETRLKDLQNNNFELNKSNDSINSSLQTLVKDKEEQEQILKKEISLLNEEKLKLDAEAKNFDGKRNNWMNKEVEYVDQINSLKKDRNELLTAKTKIEEQLNLEINNYKKEIVRILKLKNSGLDVNQLDKNYNSIQSIDFENSVMVKAKNFGIVNDIERKSIIQDLLSIIEYKFGRTEFYNLIQNQLFSNNKDNKVFIDFCNRFGLIDSKNSFLILTPLGENIHQNLVNINH